MKKALTILLLLFSVKAFAQDIGYTRKTLNKLTSKALWGRGYTKNGMAKAADFIESEFKSFGIQPMDGTTYKQHFSFPVNTFPSKMALQINGKKLVPGKDFIVGQASKGITLTATLKQIDSITFADPLHKIIVTLTDKLTWSVAQKVADYTEVLVLRTSLGQKPKNLTVAITNKLVQQFDAANICGLIKGTTNPDSIILITAHYDHLGGMGSKTYFPGANDNGSGVSFLLSLAKYYAANPPKYSIGLICFAAEEAGLLGSKYFTEQPLLPLANIRFMINVDMIGTGVAGATVVNATQYPAAFALLNKINDANGLLPKINARGKAANSDHYFFTEHGVPAFFLYTQGGIAAYHDVFDIANTLPFTMYENLFTLFIKFNEALMGPSLQIPSSNGKPPF